MVTYVKYVVMMLESLILAMSLLLVMNVPSLCVVLVTSTRGEMEHSVVLSARLDSEGTMVSSIHYVLFVFLLSP